MACALRPIPACSRRDVVSGVPPTLHGSAAAVRKRPAYEESARRRSFMSSTRCMGWSRRRPAMGVRQQGDARVTTVDPAPRRPGVVNGSLASHVPRLEHLGLRTLGATYQKRSLSCQPILRRGRIAIGPTLDWGGGCHDLRATLANERGQRKGASAMYQLGQPHHL